jgi:hypothetical protein
MKTPSPKWIAFVALTLLFAPLQAGAHQAESKKTSTHPVKESFSWDNLTKEIQLPCNIDDFKKKPELVIHGESHDTFIAALHRGFRLHQSDQQKCVVAHEGIFCGSSASKNDFLKKYTLSVTQPDKALVYGVEDEGVYSLTLVLAYLVLAASKGSDVKMFPMKSIPYLVATEPFLREAWEKIRKEKIKIGDQGKDIALLIDEGMKESPKKYHEKLEVLDKAKPFQKRKNELFEILMPLADASADLLMTKYQKTSRPPPHLKEEIEIFKDKSPDMQLVKVFLIADFTLGWRNLHIAKNIAQIYCDALKLGLPVHVLVGRSHVEGLVKIIKPLLKEKAEVRITDYQKNPEDFHSEVKRALLEWFGKTPKKSIR